MKNAAASTVALLLLVGASGCTEEQQTGPTTTELSNERQALAARVKKGQQGAKKKRPALAATADRQEGSSFGAVDLGFSYDLAGTRDPFRAFKWAQMALDMAEGANLGPLEQFDLSQLSLVAVVWKTGAAKALVQDPSGQSYIVGAGAKIGKNQGYVKDIDDNLVVVKETYVDFLGQETTKDIEMRIRRSHGG